MLQNIIGNSAVQEQVVDSLPPVEEFTAPEHNHVHMVRCITRSSANSVLRLNRVLLCSRTLCGFHGWLRIHDSDHVWEFQRARHVGDDHTWSSQQWKTDTQMYERSGKPDETSWRATREIWLGFSRGNSAWWIRAIRYERSNTSLKIGETRC